MTAELLALIATHFACADIAEQRMMTTDELQYCSAVYDNVKLAFLPDMDQHTFVDLSPEDRAAVSRAGFLAFHRWRQDNPDIVASLKRR